MLAHASNQTSSNPAEIAEAAASGPTESARPGRDAKVVPVMRTPRGFVPSGSVNSRRNQISGVFHSVRTTAPGVPRVPKPALPCFHSPASKFGLNQSSGGFCVV